MPGTELTSLPPVEGAPLRTLIDNLLEEQQRLTAVERFSKRHDAHKVPAQSRYYRDLIPRTKPGEGEQYAFAVDMDACTGCKGCVSACHSLNGLDDDELWRNVGLLHSSRSAYQQTVTTACHHCVDPACLNGCPVLAYDKDPETGIVRHLDDQCIGCQYCVLKCPYEVPKYSKARGIVRKCDMCTGRLALGEAPACVQACPNGAITIAIVDRDALRASTSPGTRLLPGTVGSSYTLPTTKFRTRRPIPEDAVAGDASVFRLQDPHWPLVFMLVLTQMAVGLFFVLPFIRNTGRLSGAALAVAGACILHLGLGVSTFHLGRPLGAWRAFLGLKRSWMSREIVAFGALAGVATASAAVHALQFLPARPFTGAIIALIPSATSAWLDVVAASCGALAIYCSAMIYIDTRRPSWTAIHTLPKFFGTAIVLGLAGATSLLAWMSNSGHVNSSVLFPAIPALILRTALYGTSLTSFVADLRSAQAAGHVIARTLWQQRKAVILTEGALFVAAIASGIAALLMHPLPAAWFTTMSAAFTFLGAICERYFYFVTSVPFKMPGPLPRERASHS